MNIPEIKIFISKSINKTDLTRRLFNGISWSLMGSIVSKFAQLLAFIVVARILGKEEYGKIGIIRSTITMFMIFSTLGMSTTATRYISLYRNKHPYKALKIYEFASKATLIFGALIAITLFFFSNTIASKSLHDISLSYTLQIGIFTLVFLSLNATQIGTLNGFEDFKSVGIQALLNGLFQIVFIIVGTYIWGINGTIAGLAFASFLYWIQLQFPIRRNIQKLKKNIKIIETENLLSIFLKFSLPSLLSSATIIPVIWYTKTLLIKHSGYTEMAVFDVSEQWYYILLFIPSSLSSIVLPILTNTSSEGSKRQYMYLIKINLLINIGVTLLLGLIIGVFSPFINQLYGKDFTNYSPMLIMLVTAIICAANNVLGQVIASKGKMWVGFGLNSLWAVWLILFSILFIIKMNLGALGLAYAMLISYFLHSIAQGIVSLSIKIS